MTKFTKQKFSTTVFVNLVIECECEYDDAGFILYQCEVCHDAEQEARCTCVQDYINPNCQECY